MEVLIYRARERATEYFFDIVTNPDDPEDDWNHVTFNYGKDMPLGKIRDEIVAIITNDYGPHDEDILQYEGDRIII